MYYKINTSWSLNSPSRIIMDYLILILEDFSSKYSLELNPVIDQAMRIVFRVKV